MYNKRKMFQCSWAHNSVQEHPLYSFACRHKWICSRNVLKWLEMSECDTKNICNYLQFTINWIKTQNYSWYIISSHHSLRGYTLRYSHGLLLLMLPPWKFSLLTSWVCVAHLLFPPLPLHSTASSVAFPHVSHTLAYFFVCYRHLFHLSIVAVLQIIIFS